MNIAITRALFHFHVDRPQTHDGQQHQQPLSVGVYPIIANYFFGVPPSVSQWHQAAGLGAGSGLNRASLSQNQRRRKRPTSAEAYPYQTPLNWHLVGQTAYY